MRFVSSRKISQLGALAFSLTTVSAFAAPQAEKLSDTQRRAIAIATYDGGAVTVGEIEDTIAVSSPLIQATALEPGNLREFYERNLRFELQLQEAERRGYRDNSEVSKLSKDNAVKVMLSREVDAPIRAAPPTPEALRAYFESHRELFSVPEKRRASALFVASEAEARKLLPQVKAADDAALQELVRTRGLEHPSKAKGGALGSFDNNGKLEAGGESLEPKLASAAFALPAVAAVSDVIALDSGRFVIIKLTEIRPGSVPSFDEVKVRVARRYDDERFDKAVEALTEAQREKLKPIVRYELIDQVDLN
jgi:hypothetical protein